MKKKWALITGASAGIGAEFASQLAAKGWSLVLIARRTDKLSEIKRMLIKKHQINCHALSIDLSKVKANQEIFNFCQENDIHISMLVNNAGYGIPGDIEATDWKTLQDMIQVMLSSLVELCHLFYPFMKRCHEGQIINVASIAGLMPAKAARTLYGSIKSFVINFTQSLHLEARDFNVHITALCPGFTYTEFHDVNGTRNLVKKVPKNYGWMLLMWFHKD